MKNEPLPLHAGGVLALDPRWIRPQAFRALVEAPATPLPATLRAAKSGKRDVDTGGAMVIDGIGVPVIQGFLSKGGMWGGTSTVEVGNQIRQLAANAEVKGILLYISSPGGTVAGTDELHGEISLARRSKPVHAYIEDVGASAAYWIASAASRITSNRLADVGSLGVFAIIEDEVEAYRRMGIKVHVVASGPRKAAGAPGTPVDEELLKEARETVELMAGAFRDAVLAGRKLFPGAEALVFSGRAWIPQKALELGLLDGIGGLSEAFAEVQAAVARRKILKSIAAGG